VIWTEVLERATRDAESRMLPTSANIATIVPANSAIATRPQVAQNLPDRYWRGD
jgi:hypothetical protein